MRNYLIIGGKDSRDFGVYISGQGTFSAPEKAYEFYNVPGRSGAILGNDHRLENIEVSYQCFIYNDFSTNIADFRTYLLSLNGYQRLTDSYHPDEYRMAVYVGPFEPEVTPKNDAGSFTLTFNCKPQRYLKSGESEYYFVQGSPQSVAGQEVLAYCPKLDPDVLVIHQTAFRQNYSYVLNKLGYNNVYANEVVIAWLDLSSFNATEVELDLVNMTGTVYAKVGFLMPTSGWVYDSTWEEAWETTLNVYKVSLSGLQYNKVNACTNIRFYRDITNTQDLVLRMRQEQTVFGGYSNNGYVYFAVDAWDYPDAASFNAYMSTLGSEVDGTLITPEAITFTAGRRDFPDGWALFRAAFDTDFIITLQYQTDSDIMSNPTMFPSSPLIRVYGTGHFTMDGVTVTITDCDSYVDIDCDLMDCYEGTTNRNNDVAFSTYNFPQLQPGASVIEVSDNITVVRMIPRWWRV